MWNEIMRLKALRGLAILTIGMFLNGSVWGIGNSVDQFTRTYEWYFQGEQVGFTFQYKWADYQFYEGRPRAYRNYAVYNYEHPDHQFLNGFGKALLLEAHSRQLNDWEQLQFIVSFVQSLEYVRESNEYPKYPIETLADKGGDCEDTAILLAALLHRMGYDALLINPPGHMAVALACKNCEGPAYERNGRRYYYIETTGSGFAIGEVPKVYRGTRDKLIPLVASKDELWTLFADEKQIIRKGNKITYTREKEPEVSYSGNSRIVTTTQIKTVVVDGKTYETTSVIRRIER